MMNLNFKLLDESLKLNLSTILVVEDVKTYARTVEQFYRYDEMSELKLFDKNQKNLKESELILITDILGYEVNSPATLKFIYADLENQLNEKPEIKTKIDRLSMEIAKVMQHELLEHALDLEEDELTLMEIFKCLGIRIETKSDTILEKMIEVIQVYRYLVKKKLLVFVNACSYLTTTELQTLIDHISLYNVDVLFLEPRPVEGVAQQILDQDYFLARR
ncbi:CRISPR type II-a/nmemi-associated protein csn2 [Enterococcus sp. DIV0176]